MSDHTSTGKILCSREQLCTILAEQIKRQRLKNTQIIVKKFLTKFRERKRRKSGSNKKEVKQKFISLPPIIYI